MALQSESKLLADYIRSKQELLAHNHILLDIYEGNLLGYVLKDLAAQLDPKAFKQVSHRVAPINILIRLVSKLAQIYKNPPTRTVAPDSESNKEHLEEFVKITKLNQIMIQANELFNFHKTVAIEPYLENGIPKLRTIPADRFIVMGTDPTDPMKVTHFIKVVGKVNDRLILHVFTDNEFLIMDDFGEIKKDLLIKSGNPEGINPFGKIPFVYINRSAHSLVPPIDTDTLTMTKLFPVLLSDLNFAVMYQAFSVLYAIDCDVDNLTQSPNALWSIKSDPNSDKTPQLGSIKPSVDIDQVIGLIKSTLSLWMQTRNIRMGDIDQITGTAAASGVSKVIDEADTSEDRQKQTYFFKNAEEELFSLIINHMEPVWNTVQGYDMGTFEAGSVVTVNFEEQKPDLTPEKVLERELKLLEAGLTTRERAIAAINPDLTSDDVNQIIQEIDSSRTVEIAQDEEPLGEGAVG